MHRRALPAIAVALTLLAVWPAAGSAFHEPKRWLFLAAAGLGALLTLPRWQWTALPLVALTALQPWRSAEAGLQAMAFAWALAAWPGLQPDVRTFVRVAGGAGAAVALVVLLQALGLDVLAFAGPDAGSGRLRLYGTLGNPDFVASVLLPIAILSLPLPRGGEGRGEGLRNLLFLIPALALTRSFATLLSAGAAALVLMVHRRSTRIAPVLLLCGVLLLSLIGRDLEATLAGRRYLLSVALPHLTEAPLLGHGLGATVQEWPAWELEYWQSRCADAACVEAHPEGRFAARQDHVHADWLEWWLERGGLGLLALLLAVGAPLLTAWRRTDGRGSVLLAALVATLTRALVDFPLHRPADLCLLAALCALAGRRDPEESSSRARSANSEAGEVARRPSGAALLGPVERTSPQRQGPVACFRSSPPGNHHAPPPLLPAAPRLLRARADPRPEARRLPRQGAGRAQEAGPGQEGREVPHARGEVRGHARQ